MGFDEKRVREDAPNVPELEQKAFRFVELKLEFFFDVLFQKQTWTNAECWMVAVL